MTAIIAKQGDGSTISLSALDTGSVRTPVYSHDSFVSTGSFDVSNPIATGTAYTAGDAIGGVITFPAVRKDDGVTCVLERVVFVVNDAAIGANPVYLHLFNAPPPTATNNSPYVPNYAAGMVYEEGLLTLTGRLNGSNGGIYTWSGSLRCTPSSTSLYGILVAPADFAALTAGTLAYQIKLVGTF